MSRFPQLNTNKSLSNFVHADFGNPLIRPVKLPPFCGDNLSRSSTFVPAINPEETMKEEVAGFTANICHSCTEIVIETHYGVYKNGRELLIITRNNHVCCCPPKLLTHVTAALRLLNFSAKLTELPSELKKAVKKWTGHDTYLVAFKVPAEKVKGKIIDICTHSRDRIAKNPGSGDSNQQNTNTHRWVLRAIESGQTTLDDDDLTDFINVTDNKTSGFLRICCSRPEEKADRGNSSLCSGIYCMFINKGSLPNL